MTCVSLEPGCVGICNGSKVKSARSTPPTTGSVAEIVLVALSSESGTKTPVSARLVGTGAPLITIGFGNARERPSKERRV